VWEQEGVRIATDALSSRYLEGTVVDYLFSLGLSRTQAEPGESARMTHRNPVTLNFHPSVPVQLTADAPQISSG
jgi:hypothetical protein